MAEVEENQPPVSQEETNQQEETTQREEILQSETEEKKEEQVEEVSSEKVTSEEVTAEAPLEEEASAKEETAQEEEEPAEEEPPAKVVTVDDIKTAPADYRFPTTNQTRHCFTRYIEYHRCVAAKGKESPDCEKYGRWCRSLCPSEWVERWDEQRENGTFPGPL